MKLKDFVIITKALDLECFEHDENITACIQWRISFVDFAERIIAHKNLKRMEFMSISKIKMWAKCVVTCHISTYLDTKKGMRTFIMILHLEMHVLICKAIGNVHI